MVSCEQEETVPIPNYPLLSTSQGERLGSDYCQRKPSFGIIVPMHMDDTLLALCFVFTLQDGQALTFTRIGVNNTLPRLQLLYSQPIP